MKHFYFIIYLFIIATSQAQTTQDTLYSWKAGVLINKQSIKPADLDSITFKRPPANLPHLTICSQVWSTKNLDVTSYTDGTPIPQITDPTAWANATTGAWCYYNNDPANGVIYGKLYNWYAVVGIYDSASLNNPSLRKQLAPLGWHMPSISDWFNIISCLGGSSLGGSDFSIAGGKMKETGTLHWETPNVNATNSSGFTALPGGERNYFGTFDVGVSVYGGWWSNSDSGNFGYHVGIWNNSDNLILSGIGKLSGSYVRCIRD